MKQLTTIRTFKRDGDTGNWYMMSYNPSRSRVALSKEGPMALNFSEAMAIRPVSSIEEARVVWRELQQAVEARGFVTDKTYTIPAR
jgi:hypothetical protein